MTPVCWNSPRRDPPPQQKGNGIFNKVAWAYKRKPFSVKQVEQTEESREPLSPSYAFVSEGSSSTATSSMETDDAGSQKSQLSSPSSDPIQQMSRMQVMESVISNMFATVSTLKNAYRQMQSAHQPYNPEELQIADKAVVEELRKLSELKQTYKERLDIIASGQAQNDLSAQPEVQKKDTLLKSYEGIISNFHSQISKKNIELEKLKDVLAQTILKKEKLERRVKRLEQKAAKDSLVNIAGELLPTPQLLESAVLGVSQIARSFAKLLISLMSTAQWDLDAAANSIEPNMFYVRETHKKLAFESYVCHRMLSGFANENFYVSGNISSDLDPEKHRQECFSEFQQLRTADPLEVINDNPDSMFSKFCLTKFLDLIHSKMEESFFGSIEHRKQAASGKHPNSQFYQNYLTLAKAVWLLHRLAFSFKPNASIFQVKRDSEFTPLYMESIVQMDVYSPGVPLKVGFTVMPGFRVGKTVIKCQVYITPSKHDE